MRHFFYYFEINKWYKHQKYIAITAKIDIYIAKFELKENEKAYKYNNNVGHTSTIIEKAAIVKQKTKNYKKTYRKKLVIDLLLIS